MAVDQSFIFCVFDSFIDLVELKKSFQKEGVHAHKKLYAKSSPKTIYQNRLKLVRIMI